LSVFALTNMIAPICGLRFGAVSLHHVTSEDLVAEASSTQAMHRAVLRFPSLRPERLHGRAVSGGFFSP
jgi:hypothetical protein